MEKYIGYRKLNLRELQIMQLSVMKLIHIVCVKYNIKYYMIGGTLLGAVRHKGFIPWDDDIDIAMMRDDFEKFKSVFDHEFDTSKLFLQHYDSDIYFQPALMRVCIKDTIMDLASEYHLHHCKNSYLDIFPLDNVPDDENLRIKHAKKLSLIDRLINLRYYHIYEKDTHFRVFVKKCVSFFISLIPVSFLKNLRIKEMTKYNDSKTACVCSTVSHYKYAKQVMPREYYGIPQLMDFEDTQLYATAQTVNYLQQLFGSNYMEIPPIEKRDKPTDVYIKYNSWNEIF